MQDIDISANCADKIRVSQYVLVVACMKSGSYNIYSRSIDPESGKQKIKEVVSVSNQDADEAYWFGESIAIIDY